MPSQALITTVLCASAPMSSKNHESIMRVQIAELDKEAVRWRRG